MPFIIILSIFFLVLLFASVKIVPQTYVFVIERLGRYYKSCNAGLNIIIPFVDRVACKVSLKEQSLDFPPQPVITKDNVSMRIDCVVFMQVVNPKLFAYGVQNPIQGIENLSATTMRAVIGGMEFDQTLTSRDVINAQMLKALDEATDAWGIKIRRAEVKNIQPPSDILDVMQKQMTAEREKRQAVLEAEGYKQASITHAEGDKAAKILAAEAEAAAAVAMAKGQAESIQIVYEAEAAGLQMLIDTGLTEEVLKLKAIQAMKDVADGNATKIFFPTDLPDIASLGLAGEALAMTGVKGAEPVRRKDAKTEPGGGHVEHPSRIGQSHITEQAVDGGHKTQQNTSAKMIQASRRTE